jgi:hypothetical protein
VQAKILASEMSRKDFNRFNVLAERRQLTPVVVLNNKFIVTGQVKDKHEPLRSLFPHSGLHTGGLSVVPSGRAQRNFLAA